MKSRSLILSACMLSLTFQAAWSEEGPVAATAANVLELAGDSSAGESLYRRNCRACHGATAAGAASFPKLVGNAPDYLINLVVRYRAGEKIGPNTPLMAQRVKDLSDQDIANVVAFIVSLGGE